jgi:hypothetical protein
MLKISTLGEINTKGSFYGLSNILYEFGYEMLLSYFAFVSCKRNATKLLRFR